MYITRCIEPLIKQNLNKGKVIVLYGARQVGKTTLIQNMLKDHPKALWFSCDQERIKAQLVPDALALRGILEGHNIVVFDEMQYLPNPGLILKIIVDNFPGITPIASGSSSFDLASKINEPLTGRHLAFQLFPLAFSETKPSLAPLDRQFAMEEALLYGSYPEIFLTASSEEKIKKLQLLSDAYLYKDILSFNLVRNSRVVRDLLVALALQIGSEVSYHELATRLGINYKTVAHYLDLLEKSFVIFRLYGFSRNLRSEISRKVKIYFYDCGIRNALINNFNPLTLRNDEGALFENYVIAETMKKDSWESQRSNFYFWRTYTQKEIDLIQEKNARLTAFEIKFSSGQNAPKTAFSAFHALYPQSTFSLITKENINTFLS